MAQRTWLFKSDPETFGWAHLEKARDRRTVWDGIRNYQARNLLRDEVRKGDGVLFYHSGDERAVVGTCRVTRSGFPEPGLSTWFAVEIEVVSALATPVALEAMRAEKGLASMALLKRGNRLSIQPVTEREWEIVKALGDARRRAPRTSGTPRGRST